MENTTLTCNPIRLTNTFLLDWTGLPRIRWGSKNTSSLPAFNYSARACFYKQHSEERRLLVLQWGLLWRQETGPQTAYAFILPQISLSSLPDTWYLTFCVTFWLMFLRFTHIIVYMFPLHWWIVVQSIAIPQFFFNSFTCWWAFELLPVLAYNEQCCFKHSITCFVWTCVSFLLG